MAELFVEIGTEELPARFVAPAMEGIAAALTRLLGGLAASEPRVWGTPRRIAVAFANVHALSPVVEKLVTGPSVSVAFRDAPPRDYEQVKAPRRRRRPSRPRTAWRSRRSSASAARRAR